MRRILNEIELANTREKLNELEQLYEARKREIGGNERIRRMTMTSLKKMINQLKEEIIWTEVHQPAPK